MVSEDRKREILDAIRDAVVQFEEELDRSVARIVAPTNPGKIDAPGPAQGLAKVLGQIGHGIDARSSPSVELNVQLPSSERLFSEGFGEACELRLIEAQEVSGFHTKLVHSTAPCESWCWAVEVVAIVRSSKRGGPVC